MIDPYEHTLNILDVETNGTYFQNNRIIEIAVYKISKLKLIDKYVTLINPEQTVPPFILQMTGITETELADAPRFTDIAKELQEYLEDGTLIAHNAQFDYSFVSSEFARTGRIFQQSYGCTVKLSRTLFPEHQRHNLDVIIERLGLEITGRHRAEPDTEATWEFFRRTAASVEQEKFRTAFERSLKKVVNDNHRLPY